MTKNFNNACITLTTSESTIYTAPSKSMTLLIQAVNPTAGATTCELWMTDGTDAHIACLFPSQSISAYGGISDNAKHVLPTGYKIRGIANTGSSIYIEVSILEGM